MPAPVAIIAALPREIASLVRGSRPDSDLPASGIHLFRMPGAVVVAAGMGSTRATLAVRAALSAGPVSTLVSVGLAGACVPSLRAGSCVDVSAVIDTRTGERFEASLHDQTQAPSHLLATSETIASVHEKARLAASYGAALVDMEAATVARLAAAQGLPFRAIKGISDAHDFELASLSRFSGAHGSFRTAAFALHTAMRPHTWSKAARLGRESNRALECLRVRLLEVIAAAQVS